MKYSKTTLILSISLISNLIFGQSIEKNPLIKLEDFTGNWSFTELVKSPKSDDFEINNSGYALIYFTKDSSAVVVDEQGENGHLFRGIHTYNFENKFYNNFSNRTDGGINWSHYHWNSDENRAIWYEGQTIDPNDPSASRMLSKNNFKAQWYAVNENEHIFQVEIFNEINLIYARKVVYRRK